MKTLGKSKFVGMLVALVFAAQATALAQAGTGFELTIKGFEGEKGHALVSLYDDAESWLKIPKAVQTQRVELTGEPLKIRFDGLKPGTYAVSVIHDANDNGELDMRWFPFPKPKEGTGASRDPKTKMGPPKWQDASIELKAGETKSLDIQMTYL